MLAHYWKVLGYTRFGEQIYCGLLQQFGCRWTAVIGLYGQIFYIPVLNCLEIGMSDSRLFFIFWSKVFAI